MPLSGKAILVTGGAQGLGAAFVRQLLQLGADVVAADLAKETLDALATELGGAEGHLLTTVADVGCASDLNAAVDLAADRFGRLDGFVNNAGVQYMGEIDDLAERDIRRLVDVNVLGVVNGVRAALRWMRPAAAGSIVNITSGAQCGMSLLSVYGASKGAVASLTYGLAVDLAETGIRVNAVAPLASTPMTAATAAVRGEVGAPKAGRALPDPVNNAAAVGFLLSDRSAGVTGQVLRVDHEGVSVMSHPARIEESLVHGSAWTFESFESAFDKTLSAHLAPVGNRAGVLGDWKPA